MLGESLGDGVAVRFEEGVVERPVPPARAYPRVNKTAYPPDGQREFGEAVGNLRTHSFRRHIEKAVQAEKKVTHP